MRSVVVFVILSLSLLVWEVPAATTGTVPLAFPGVPPGSTDFPWAMFRNNALRTGVTPASAPSTGSLSWSFGTTGILYSSPAVVDGTVFIASWDGNVYAIDEYSGAQRWVFPSGQYVSSSPAVSSGLVYITTACPFPGTGPFTCTSGSVYALDELSGSVVWQKVNTSPLTSSPLVADGKVFYGTITFGNGQVFALDAMSGNLAWPRQAYLSDAVESSLSVDNGRVFVGQINGAVVALNETSGAQLWSVAPAGGTNIVSALAAGLGRVYVGTSTRGVVALNEATGGTVWTFPTGGFNASSVALSGGIAYFGTGRGIVYAVNATTGVQIWIYPRTGTIGAVSSSPAIALGSNMLLVGSNNRNLYSLNVTGGARLWSYVAGSAISSSPAVADGRVFFGGHDQNVYALGPIAPKLQASISSSATSLRPGQSCTITVTVTNGTSPVSGANLTFTSSLAGGFTQPVMTGPGVYVSNFTAPLVGSSASTTIQVTAIMSGYVSGSAQTTITLSPFPALSVVVSPKPPAVSPGGELVLQIRVTNGSQLVSGASIFLSASSGGSFSGLTDGGNGNYTAIYSTPLQGSSSVVTVQASKPGFSSGQGQATVTINGFPDITSVKVNGIPFWLLLVGGSLIFLLVVIGAVGRRRKPPIHYKLPPVPSYALGRGVFREGLSRRFLGSVLLGLAAIAGS